MLDVSSLKKVIRYCDEILKQLDYKKFSDIDLAILCPEELPDEIVSTIRLDFEFSDLPYSVDFINYQSMDNQFKLCIKDDLKLIFEQK